jgi:hypothetical protein
MDSTAKFDQRSDAQQGRESRFTAASPRAISSRFLIDICRLEIAVTHSKQTMGATSNRHVCGTLEQEAF